MTLQENVLAEFLSDRICATSRKISSVILWWYFQQSQKGQGIHTIVDEEQKIWYRHLEISYAREWKITMNMAKVTEIEKVSEEEKSLAVYTVYDCPVSNLCIL